MTRAVAAAAAAAGSPGPMLAASAADLPLSLAAMAQILRDAEHLTARYGSTTAACQRLDELERVGADMQAQIATLQQKLSMAMVAAAAAQVDAAAPSDHRLAQLDADALVQFLQRHCACRGDLHLLRDVLGDYFRVTAGGADHARALPSPPRDVLLSVHEIRPIGPPEAEDTPSPVHLSTDIARKRKSHELTRLTPKNKPTNQQQLQAANDSISTFAVAATAAQGSRGAKSPAPVIAKPSSGSNGSSAAKPLAPKTTSNSSHNVSSSGGVSGMGAAASSAGGNAPASSSTSSSKSNRRMRQEQKQANSAAATLSTLSAAASAAAAATSDAHLHLLGASRQYPPSSSLPLQQQQRHHPASTSSTGTNGSSSGNGGTLVALAPQSSATSSKAKSPAATKATKNKDTGGDKIKDDKGGEPQVKRKRVGTPVLSEIVVKQNLVLPHDKRNIVELKQSSQFVRLEALDELNRRAPWDDVFKQRALFSHILDYDVLDERARRWFVAVLRVQFVWRREFWERLHWLPMSETVCTGPQWEKYRQTRKRRANKAIAAWRKIYGDSLELMRLGLLPEDVWCDVALWYMPATPLYWLPNSSDLALELEDIDAKQPVRCYHLANLPQHPFYRDESLQHKYPRRFELPPQHLLMQHDDKESRVVFTPE